MPNPSLPAIHSLAAFCISYFVVCSICECQRPPWLLLILKLCISNCDSFIPLLKFLKSLRKGLKSDKKILKVGLDHLLNMDLKGLKMFFFCKVVFRKVVFEGFPEGLVKILKSKFRRNFEAVFLSIFCC